MSVFGVPCWDGILPFAVFSLFPCWSQKEVVKTGNAYSVGDPPGKRKFPFLASPKVACPSQTHKYTSRGPKAGLDFEEKTQGSLLVAKDITCWANLCFLLGAVKDLSDLGQSKSFPFGAVVNRGP